MAKAMSDGPESGPYRLADSPSHLLHRAEQLAADRFTQLVGNTITLRQFAVLAAISESPGLTQAELVRATGIDRSTLTDMLARMEKRDWITRTASDKDARAHSVRLAAGGVSMLVASTRYARAADAAVLDLLPRTKARSFLNTLAKLLKLGDQAAERAERQQRREARRAAREKARGKRRRGKGKDASGTRKNRA